MAGYPAKAMRFEIDLVPLADIAPWMDGKGQDPHLSWFGFSDARFRIQVGAEYLLSYSDDVVANWVEQYPGAYAGPCVGYPGAAIWDDVLDMVPDVLRPVPVPIADFLNQSHADIGKYFDCVQAWEEEQEQRGIPERRILNVLDLAIEWLTPRFLDPGYLNASPRIWMWSANGTVDIAWDNRGIEIDGRPVWSAQRGVHRIRLSEFMAAVEEFNDRFIAAMAQRVDEVCEAWDRPDVRVDFEGLKREQAERAGFFDGYLDRGPHFTRSWDEVTEAIRIVRSV